MLKHTDVFNRCMEDRNYPALMQVESLVEQDVDAALEEYQTAVNNWENVNAKQLNAKDEHYDYALDLAYLEMQRKYVDYLEKHMLHSMFNGFYKS